MSSFSGEIRYFDLKGRMLWGEIYKDGMKVGKISLVESPTEYSAEKVQTRGYETYCDYHLIEYETCYHYGYDMGEGYEESGVECDYDYEYEEVCTDVWVDDEDDVCLYCGSPSCSGECLDINNDQLPISDDKLDKQLKEITPILKALGIDLSLSLIHISEPTRH